jgi:hypothetical protein
MNKGGNDDSAMKGNSVIGEQNRHTTFRHMIDIADGFSDDPTFSMVRRHGGKAFAV